jgi:hypothetical protein
MPTGTSFTGHGIGLSNTIITLGNGAQLFQAGKPPAHGKSSDMIVYRAASAFQAWSSCAKDLGGIYSLK